MVDFELHFVNEPNEVQFELIESVYTSLEEMVYLETPSVKHPTPNYYEDFHVELHNVHSSDVICVSFACDSEGVWSVEYDRV